VERLLSPPVVVSSWESTGNRSVVLSGGAARYTEVYAFENGALRQLTRQNDALFAELEIAGAGKSASRARMARKSMAC
jgi:hypothetical protein